MRKFVVGRDVWGISVDLIAVDRDGEGDVISVSADVAKATVALLKTIEKLNARIDYLEQTLGVVSRFNIGEKLR